MATTKLTGTLIKSGSIPVTALGGGVVSSSVQLATSLPAGTISSSAQYPGWVTSSGQIDYNSIQNKLSGVVSSSAQVAPLLPGGTVSSSAQYPGWVTSSGQISITATAGYSTFSSSIATKNDTQDISINALNAATSSYAINSTIQSQLAGVASSSTQVKAYLPGGTVTSSAQYPGWVTSSTQIDYNSIQNKLSGVVSSSTQVQPLLPAGTVSSSAQYPGWVTASSQIDYNSIQNKLSGVVSSSAQIAPLLPGGVVSSSTQTQANLPGGTVSSSAQYPGWVTASSQIDYNSIQNKLSGVVSSSAQVQPLLPGGSVSSSAQYPGWVTASSQIDYNSITNKLSGVVSSSAQVAPLLPGGTVSASAQYPGWVTASSQVLLNSITGTTFSNQSFYFPIDLRVEGNLTAQQIYTEYVSSSVIYESGSSKFGDTADDVMSVTGSILVLGGRISGSMTGMFSASSQVDYNSITNKLSGVVSSSAQVAPLLPGGTVSSSAQYPGWMTSSAQVVWSLVNYNSGIISSSTQQVVSTYTNATDNRVLTSTGAGGVNAESTLTYDGAVLAVSTNNAKYFQGGDDAALWDVNVANTIGVYGVQDSTVGGIKLGSSGQTLYSNATGVGIGTTAPGTTLHVQGNTSASSAQFTGVISGSGTSYRLVVPVGTNFYAT